MYLFSACQPAIEGSLRSLLLDLIHWVWCCTAYRVRESELPALRQRGYEVLTRLELLSSFRFCTISRHYLAHLVDVIARHGPLSTVWTYARPCAPFASSAPLFVSIVASLFFVVVSNRLPDERWIGKTKRSLHSMKSTEVLFIMCLSALMLSWRMHVSSDVVYPCAGAQAGLARGVQVREACALMTGSSRRRPREGAHGRGRQVVLSSIQREAVHHFYLTHDRAYKNLHVRYRASRQ